MLSATHNTPKRVISARRNRKDMARFLAGRTLCSRTSAACLATKTLLLVEPGLRSTPLSAATRLREKSGNVVASGTTLLASQTHGGIKWSNYVLSVIGRIPVAQQALLDPLLLTPVRGLVELSLLFSRPPHTERGSLVRLYDMTGLRCRDIQQE